MKGIYQIRCTVYDERRVGGFSRYVGKSSTNIQNRFDEHLWRLVHDEHRNRDNLRDKLQNAWNKYGQDNFVFEIVEILDDKDDKYICEREKYWIKFYDSHYNGYNQTDGGDGVSGRDITEATRLRYSKAQSGRVYTEEARKAISKGVIKASAREDVIRNRRNAQLSRYSNEKERERLAKYRSIAIEKKINSKWMNNGITNKQVPPADIDNHLSEGWSFGMKKN